MKKLFLFTAALILTFAINAPAQDDKIDGILVKMEEADKKINAIEVDYTQEIFYSATNETQNITGNLKYKKPENIFIVQRTPQEQHIYIDGKKITIYTPENEQAVVDNWKNMLNGDFAPASLVSFGSSWKELKKENSINYIGEDEDNYIIELYPANKKDWTMQMYVSKNTLYPQKAVVTAPGLLVKVDLKNYKVNPNLKKDTFKFTPGKDVEVIKLN